VQFHAAHADAQGEAAEANKALLPAAKKEEAAN
jgi:hypothetical protein